MPRRRPAGLRHRGSRPDLAFLPLTAGTFLDPAVPQVALVHDLQHAFRPELFSPQQQRLRARQLAELCRHAARLICVSEFVRDSLLATVPVDPGRVVVIRHGLLREVAAEEPESAKPALARLGVVRGEFLLYPANFWPHKNHLRLLEALAQHVARRPGSRLRLVCTGALDERAQRLHARAAELGLGDRVTFPGYLPEAELGALLRSCRAVIYPSLFEGFGLPVLEAMAAGRPVLCSDTTSLPEVAGDAAFYFDPTDPAAIAGAIERLEADPLLATELIARGRARARTFGTRREMAAAYLRVLREVVSARSAAIIP
jgi:glycosyltransferase involved in cell wall biosynthesis